MHVSLGNVKCSRDIYFYWYIDLSILIWQGMRHKVLRIEISLTRRPKPVTPEPLTNFFATFGLGSSSRLLVANWKKYLRQFH